MIVIKGFTFGHLRWEGREGDGIRGDMGIWYGDGVYGYRTKKGKTLQVACFFLQLVAFLRESRCIF